MEDATSVNLPPLPKRLFQVFVSPGELFEVLREEPVWFWTLVVVGLLVGLSLVLIPVDLWIEFSRSQMIEQGRPVPAGFEDLGKVMQIASVGGGVIMTFVMTFIISAVVTFYFAFLLGDEGRYVQYLSVVAHASVISAVGAIALVPLRIAQGDPSANLSLGTFAFFLSDGYLFRVLRMLDLVALWSYVVMAIGVSKMSDRRSVGSALGFFLVFAAVFALLFGLIPQ